MGTFDGGRVAVVGSVEHPWRRTLVAALAAEGAEQVELDGPPVDLVVHLTPVAGDAAVLSLANGGLATVVDVALR